MPQLKISHIMLGVESKDRAVKFYRDKLGLKLQMEFEGFAFFEGGGCALVMSEALARANTYKVGATEVVFGVEGVREACDELRAKGVEFVNEPRAVSGPMFAANFKDPDGHLLSVFGPEKKA